MMQKFIVVILLATGPVLHVGAGGYGYGYGYGCGGYGGCGYGGGGGWSAAAGAFLGSLAGSMIANGGMGGMAKLEAIIPGIRAGTGFSWVMPIFGSKRHEARTVAQTAALEGGA
ncbi:hypothetical protein RB195_013695 [Necator americanus]|uniref:Glycine zipper 2TM domain-containing protein n=1 Tax=Necator americanus TaxID=51031 RepID=A0ABR1DWW3_NECAM